MFGEGVVNDATSVVLFNAITKFDLSDMNSLIAFKFAGKFIWLFVLSTLLGILVSLYLIMQAHKLCLFSCRFSFTDRHILTLLVGWVALFIHH